jgi:hypothetical protein
MAVRENTERQDLPPEDRRVAVQRLQALYAEVYGALAPTTPAEPTTGFTRWAAQVLCVTERTIRQDLQLAALGLDSVPAGRMLPAPPPPEAPAALRVTYALRASRTLVAALADLTATLALELPLAPAQRTALHESLGQLQTSLTTLQATWPLDERTTDATRSGAA